LEVVESTAGIREYSREHRREGETMALVPTMGALHDGHLSLVEKASEVADRTVVSIFVNPMQFGPSEDLESYPRDLDADFGRLDAIGVDCVFTPDRESVYPEGFQTRVRVEGLERHLCGLSRSVHFSGVATVVLKLFNMCEPDFAVFGMKDFQQVRVIERMVVDLDLGVRIVRHETVREKDGLAMSSRNMYLTDEERGKAPTLYATLVEMAGAVATGETDAVMLAKRGRDALSSVGIDVEYLSICDVDTLEDVTTIHSVVVMATAARLGGARLIDNVIVEPGKGGIS